MLKKNFNAILNTVLFKTVQETADELQLQTYVIGGFVRDHLLNRNRTNTDIDFVVIGSGIELAQALQKKLKKASKVQVFKTYGTAMLKWGDITIEFVGARKESYAPESRNPKITEGSLEDDQKRRDFTINALAISLNKETYGRLLDPFNGIDDLQKGILRTPLEPGITYSDDPLRMLRAVRFASQLNFVIEKKSLDAIQEHAERISIITKERCVDELHKIMMCDTPSLGLLLLDKVKILPLLLPELIDLKGIEEVEGQTHKDNFFHTFEVVDNICRNTDNLWLRWAALLHDIGKAPTKRFHKKNGWTFHGHEFVGAKMVYKLFKRLKMPLNDKMKFVQKMVLMSSRPIVIAEDLVTDSAVRRLIFDAGDHINDLITLCEADITTKNPKRFKQYHNNFKIVRKKIVEVEERDHIRNFQPPVSGEIIMKSFNLKPSKAIGQIKEAIKEAILEGEITNEFDAAFELMKKEGEKLGLKFVEN
ncbi:MAG: CCA tRNA nucleotidyltransferase [Flavobacteriaceae bacterium]